LERLTVIGRAGGKNSGEYPKRLFYRCGRWALRGMGGISGGRARLLKRKVKFELPDMRSRMPYEAVTSLPGGSRSRERVGKTGFRKAGNTTQGLKGGPGSGQLKFAAVIKGGVTGVRLKFYGVRGSGN